MTLHQKLERLTRFCSKRAVSVAAGLGPQYLYNALAEKNEISARSAFALARVLRVDVTWLLDPDQSWPPVRIESADDREPAPCPRRNAA
jgi:hypothetical protein